MQFRNLEVFEEFLANNLKADCYNVKAYLEDLEKRLSETSNAHYELSSFETKSKLPEIIYFDVDLIHNEEEDTYEYIITF